MSQRNLTVELSAINPFYTAQVYFICHRGSTTCATKISIITNCSASLMILQSGAVLTDIFTCAIVCISWKTFCLSNSGCLALAGAQGKTQGLSMLAGLPAQQTEAADLLQALIQRHPASLQAANTEATSAEHPPTTLSRSTPSTTTIIGPVPTEMHPTAGNSITPDPAHVTSPGSVGMVDTGTMTEATVAAVLMIGILAAEEDEATAPAQAAELLRTAENGKGTALAIVTATATGKHSNHEAPTAAGTAAGTTDIKAATIVMTDTGTRDLTGTEAVAETGTAEKRAPCLALHSSARRYTVRTSPLYLAVPHCLSPAKACCSVRPVSGQQSHHTCSHHVS